MLISLFRRKPLDSLIAEGGDELHGLKKSLTTVDLIGAGHRRHHRGGNLRHAGRCHVGKQRPAARRSGSHRIDRAHRRRLRVLRPLLCGVRQPGAGCRFRLHLQLRDAGRAGSMDHRMGPDPRVRRGQYRGRNLVGGAISASYCSASASRSRHGWRRITARHRSRRGPRQNPAPAC